LENLSKEELERRREITTTDYHGIFAPHEIFYILSILQSAELCLTSYSRYLHSISSNDPQIIFANIQESMSHAASVSKFFWPPSKDKLTIARSKKLQNNFELANTAPLSNRKLRNAIEHFDEKLDSFLVASGFGDIFPKPILDDHKIADEPTANIFKLVDTAEDIVVILNQKFAFKPIIDDVRQVLQKCMDLDNNGGRL
jgi:hypothetical protein